MNKLDSGNVFCYVRPWNVDQFTYLGEKIAPNAKVIRVSEHVKFDEGAIVSNYYENLKRIPREAISCIGFSLDEQVDVIVRCRLLRRLPRDVANRHLLAMFEAISASFDKYKPCLVLSLTVDSYVIDLLRIVSRLRGVPFVGFIGTFVNGYYRVSARGESTKGNSVDVLAIEELRDRLLGANYTPSFNKKSVSRPRYSLLRRWAANLARVPYFFAKRLVSGDYYNYHYWASHLISSDHFHLVPPSDPGRADWEQVLERSGLPTLYIPLQMFPECTVDYWCSNADVISYYDTLFEVIDRLSVKFSIVVKEHPSVFGSRPAWFYKKLKSSAVIIAPTFVASNALVEKVDAVLVWTGSVGFEALLRGKAVFGLARPFYASGPRFFPIKINPDLDDMLCKLEFCKRNPISEVEQNKLISFLLAQLLKGDFINDGSWSADSLEHRKKIEEIAVSFCLACEGDVLGSLRGSA
ncbi:MULTISPECIES: hypothetical protein [Pseudomonas]|uniref:capsular polysaccharide export protein, LipB/KpsS family n=1 Tax=Pseudomonas TaxID=286 RepID=UPI001F2470EB|nr:MULTISPECIES: hypothetical protein [Pseudomonas]UIP87266.1 hypothetical protein HU825_12175 [Pseudomonas phenolilytica]